jgi:hypothetical protein
MRNIALAAKRQLDYQRKLVNGFTASQPAYKELDLAGHKEWVVDVYAGPTEGPDLKILTDVPIAPYARNLVSGLNIPVLLERSRQGCYTVIGRSKVMTAGAQTEGGSVFDPTYHLVTHNLADLGALHVADLDWEVEEFGDPYDDDAIEWDVDEFMVARAWNAFGRQVAGPGATDPVAAVAPAPKRVTTVKHVKIGMSEFGDPGDEDAIVWDVSEFEFPIYKLVTLVV